MAISTSDRLLQAGTELRLTHADTGAERTVRHRMAGMRGWKLLEDRYGSIERAMEAIVNLTKDAKTANLGEVIGLVCRAIERRARDLGEAARVWINETPARELARLASAGIVMEFGRAEEANAEVREAEAVAIATMICSDHLLSLSEKKRVDDLCTLLAAGLQAYNRELAPAKDRDEARVQPEDLIDWIDLPDIHAYVGAIQHGIDVGTPAPRTAPAPAQPRPGGPIDPEVAWAEQRAAAQAGGLEGNAPGTAELSAPSSGATPASTGDTSTTSPPRSSDAPTTTSGTA